MSPIIVFQILIGLALLSFCGDALVKGSINLGLKFNISPLIIGLTVVAFGTSAPELIVAIQASISGLSGLALGNVVGSNIANVLLVLGLPILLFSLDITASTSREDYWIMFVATLFFMILLLAGTITFWQGILLIVFQLIILVRSYKMAIGPSVASSEDSTEKIAMTMSSILIMVGVIGLPVGAHFLIKGAVGLAEFFDISEEVIGLSVVAIGTSLPELATTFSAVWRRQGEVVLGSIIGSNLFNILFIVGVAALIAPLEFKDVDLVQSLSFLLISILLFMSLIIRPRVIKRVWGIIFISFYSTYIWVLIL